MYWLSNLCRCCFDGHWLRRASSLFYWLFCMLVIKYQTRFSLSKLFCIPLLFSVCSEIVNLIHHFNQIVFQIYFHCISHYLIPINDRDVNCYLVIYSSRVSAVCLLVLKIIFVIEIIFCNFYRSLKFLYLSIICFSQYPHCFKLSNRFKISYL